MSEAIIDIETIAVQGQRAIMYRMHLAKTVEAPSNYKDIDKINAYVENAVTDKMNKTSLDPNTGEIALIGILHNETHHMFQRTDKISEKQMLEHFLTWCKENDIARWMGKGIKRFDFPFIRTRAIVHGLHELNELFRFPRYPDQYLVSDLEDEFWWPGAGPRSFVSQGVIAQALGIEYNADVTGADMGDMWIQRNWDGIVEHCADDLNVCRDIFNRIVPAPYIPNEDESRF